MIKSRNDSRVPSLAVLAVISVTMFAVHASAEPSAYCRKVNERADDDANSLIAPRLVLQSHRFPNAEAYEGGAVIGRGFQMRAGLSLSASDIYKSFSLKRAAKADCRAHDARVALEQGLAQPDDEAKRSALEAQVLFLEGHIEEIRQVEGQALARFSAHAITVFEIEDLRGRAMAFERILIEARGQIAQLRAVSRTSTEFRSRSQTSVTTRQLADTYISASRDLEAATARTRAAELWQIEATAGVISASQAGWYGLIEISFNLAGLARTRRAVAYMRAREEEIAKAPYELFHRVGESRQKLLAVIEHTREEIALVERELEIIRRTEKVLEGSLKAIHQQDRLRLARLTLEAKQVFHRTYLTGLQHLLD